MPLPLIPRFNTVAPSTERPGDDDDDGGQIGNSYWDDFSDVGGAEEEMYPDFNQGEQVMVMK